MSITIKNCVKKFTISPADGIPISDLEVAQYFLNISQISITFYATYKPFKKNEGPLPKILNSPPGGTSVSLPLGCKSLVWPLVENLFTNHANGPGRHTRPPAQVRSAGLFNIFRSVPLFFDSLTKRLEN